MLLLSSFPLSSSSILPPIQNPFPPSAPDLLEWEKRRLHKFRTYDNGNLSISYTRANLSSIISNKTDVSDNVSSVSGIEDTTNADANVKTLYGDKDNLPFLEQYGLDLLESYSFVCINIITLRQILIGYDMYAKTFSSEKARWLYGYDPPLPLSNWYLTTRNFKQKIIKERIRRKKWQLFI